MAGSHSERWIVSANTTWYVRVTVPREEWRRVTAVTQAEAEYEALFLGGPVLSVLEVRHWTEYEIRETEPKTT